MKVLIACEYSGTVREAFAARGHDAWSCDILPTERPGQHIVNDVRNILDAGWDLMIAHPPCTYLANVGMPWFSRQPDRWRKAREAAEFFMTLMNADIPMRAIENPIGLMSRWYRKPDQIVNPSDFGDGFTKKTCLWLTNLPPLMATIVISNPVKNWTELKVRSPKERAKTFPGMAAALAAQWGNA